MADAVDFLEALPVEKPLNFSTYVPKPIAKVNITGYGSGDASLNVKEWDEDTKSHQKKGNKVNELEGVFLLAKYPRGMFPKRKEGEENKASRPLCTSPDGVWGEPTPKAQMMGVTGYCATCQEAEFGGLCRGTGIAFLLRESDEKCMEIGISQTNVQAFLDFLEEEGGEEAVRRKLIKLEVIDLDDDRKTARLVWSVIRDGEYTAEAMALAGETLTPFLQPSERPNLIPQTQREEKVHELEAVNPNPIQWPNKRGDNSDE